MTHPDQTVRVPVAPTMDMILAGSKTICAEMPEDYFAAKNAWAAMIAAAPSPEAEGAGPGGWLIRESDDGWLWTGTKIAAVAALTEGLEVVSLASLQRPQTTAPDSGLVDRLDPIWPNAVTAMLDRFDRAKGKGGYPTANEREAMRRCLEALAQARKGAA